MQLDDFVDPLSTQGTRTCRGYESVAADQAQCVVATGHTDCVLGSIKAHHALRYGSLRVAPLGSTFAFRWRWSCGLRPVVGDCGVLLLLLLLLLVHRLSLSLCLSVGRRRSMTRRGSRSWPAVGAIPVLPHLPTVITAALFDIEMVLVLVE